MKVTVQNLQGSGPILAKTTVDEQGQQYVRIYQRAKTINPFKQLYYAIKNVTDSRIKPAEQWVRESTGNACGKLDQNMLTRIFNGIKTEYRKSSEAFIKPNGFSAHDQHLKFSEKIVFGFTDKKFTSSLDLISKFSTLILDKKLNYAVSKPKESEFKEPQKWAAYTADVFNRFEENALRSKPSSAGLKSKEQVNQCVITISRYYFSEIENITLAEKTYVSDSVNYLSARLNPSTKNPLEKNLINMLKEVQDLLTQDPPKMEKDDLKNLFTKTLTEAVTTYQQFETALKKSPDRETLLPSMKMDRFLLRDYKQMLTVFLHFYEGSSRPNANQKAMLSSLASFLFDNKQFIQADMLANFEKRFNELGIPCGFSASPESSASTMFDVSAVSKRTYNVKRPDEDQFADFAGSESESATTIEIDAPDAGEE